MLREDYPICSRELLDTKPLQKPLQQLAGGVASRRHVVELQVLPVLESPFELCNIVSFQPSASNKR